MGGEGLEHTTFPPGMIEVAQVGGAECGALSAPAGPEPEPAPDAGLDPALALVTRRWPTLTGEQRLAILEIVQ